MRDLKRHCDEHIWHLITVHWVSQVGTSYGILPVMYSSVILELAVITVMVQANQF